MNSDEMVVAGGGITGIGIANLCVLAMDPQHSAFGFAISTVMAGVLLSIASFVVMVIEIRREK